MMLTLRTYMYLALEAVILYISFDVYFFQMNEIVLADSDRNPNPSTGHDTFKSRRRSLDIEIVNNTRSALRFVAEHFRYGTRYVSAEPLNIRPGETSYVYVCSRLFSIVGVTGGLMYQLGGTGKCLYIGFDNPVIGSWKNFISLGPPGRSAEWASGQPKSGAAKNISIDGYDVIAVIKPPRRSPFRLMQFTVEEKRK